MDEKQPHLHYSFIPVSDDRNPQHEQQEKVCAKEVLTRNDLTTFHDDLQKYLRDRMPDREINIISGITKEQGRNMTVQEIKLNAKAERLKEKEKEVSDREERLTKKEEKLKEQKKQNLERQKELDKQKRELQQKEKSLASKERDLSKREKDIAREAQKQKDFNRYIQYRENYCNDRGLTQTQYERECFQAKLTNSLKPYPEIANPILPRQEREEIQKGYKEQQEDTHTRNREREEPSR